jgi:hypothetical protein
MPKLGAESAEHVAAARLGRVGRRARGPGAYATRLSYFAAARLGVARHPFAGGVLPSEEPHFAAAWLGVGFQRSHISQSFSAARIAA